MSATKEHHHDAIEAGQRGTKQHPIGWLNMPGYKPETWNPIVGCSKVSPGCDNCYALKMAKRIAGMERKNGRHDYRLVLMPNSDNKQTEWNGHTILRTDHLIKPMEWKTPRMVFVCSMGDLFHESADFSYIDLVFSAMSDYDQHIYILLTKRPENMLKFWQWKREQHGIDWHPKDNVWIGVTAENQEQANKRIPILLQIPASKHFVSIEPMLGPVDLNWINDEKSNCIDSLTIGSITHDNLVLDEKLDWVICGGETGHKARPMHPDWARSLRDQCKAAGTPYFFKQWGEWAPAHDLQCSELGYKGKKWFNFDPETSVCMVGRKAAGNLLDGQQHHEWPASTNSAAKINL